VRPTPTQPRLITAPEAAAYLSLPLRAFTRLRIGRIALGSRVLYDRHALDAWLDAATGLDSSRGPRSLDDAEAALARFIADQPDASRRP
jgi:hypothetical protein